MTFIKTLSISPDEIDKILNNKEDNIIVKNIDFTDFVFLNDDVKNICFEFCIFGSIEKTRFYNCVFSNCLFESINKSEINKCTFNECDFKDNFITNTNFCEIELIKNNYYNAQIINSNFTNILKNENNSYFDLQCPEKGEFIGYKKLYNAETKKWFICELLIPEDAKRSSATTLKCRCSKAKVLDIIDIETNKSVYGVQHSVLSDDSNVFYLFYINGEYVYPDYWDEDRWNECSNGIHFFMNKQNALNY